MRFVKSVPVLAMILFFGYTSFAQTLTVRQSVRNDTSPPLRVLVESAPLLPEPFGTSEVPLGTIPLPVPPALPDTVLQTAIGPNVSAGIIQNFEGVPANGFAPPDTNGAAGTNQYVHIVNTRFAVFGKTGATLLGPSN